MKCPRCNNEMINVMHFEKGKNFAFHECKKCNTIFLYTELDEEMVKPPAIAYTIQCPICKDKFVTRNYYKNGEIAFDHRKKLSLDGE